MKLYNKIIGYCTSALVLASLFGCAKEADLVKPSALLAESSVTVAAKGGEAVAFTVYSDEDWFVDAEEDWLYVTPTSGTGTMDVEITADDNVIDGVMQKPRQGTITIANRRGYSIKSVVYQKGDTYFGDPDYTVTQALAMENDATAKIKGAQVMALTLSGMVISDGTSNLMVDGVGKDVKIGDKIDINGKAKVEEGTYMHFVLDECEIVSEGEPVYPTAKDITAEIGTAAPEALEFVTVKGSIVGLATEGILAGAAIRVAGATVRMMVAEVPASLGLAEVNYHKVEVSGYYTGKSGSNLRFIPAVFKDNGIDESVVPVPSDPGTVLFEDNFDWMEPYVDAAIKAGTNIGSSVEENNAGGAAPNLYTTASLKDLANALLAKGYKNANYNVQDGIYPQKCYWKFGKTNVHTGLELPAIEYYGELQLLFDWSPHMTGSGNIDKLTLVVAVTTGESTVIAGEYSYKDWSKGQLAWHPVKTTINVTPESIIQIRPSQLENHDGIDQQRFYLDNIVVRVPAPDAEPVYANIVVDPDEALTFEGNGSDKKITVTSDVNFNLTTSEKWITLSEYEGKKNNPTEITVTCAASDLSTLREGKITITSGDSSKEIRVIQSAAGQTLEPFVSLVGSNSVSVLGQGEEFGVKIQSNIDFDTEILSDWITAVPVAAPAALVETTSLKFKAAANLTGAPRTGSIRFYKDKIESVLTIVQDKFEPSIKVSAGAWNILPGTGIKLPVHIESNVEFTVTAPGLTLPVSSAKAGTYDVNFDVPANTGAPRTVSVEFKNEEYSYTTALTLKQTGSTEVFFDDFSWVAPFVTKWNDANSGKKVGDTVGTQGKSGEAPNVWSDATIKGIFTDELAARGYEDLQPSKKVMYLQDQYLKLGKTGGNNNALGLPKITSLTAPTDVAIEFDHATMVQGSGVCDDAKIVVVIEGDGTFENGTKCSEILPVIQADNTYSWTHSGTFIKGMTSETRLVVVMYRVVMNKNSEGVYEYTGKYNFSVGGAGRIFIDNIKITK